jgi:hypothetical protein
MPCANITRSAYIGDDVFETAVSVVAQFKSRWLCRKLAMICCRQATAVSRED